MSDVIRNFPFRVMQQRAGKEPESYVACQTYAEASESAEALGQNPDRAAWVEEYSFGRWVRVTHLPVEGLDGPEWIPPNLDEVREAFVAARDALGRAVEALEALGKDVPRHG